MANDWMVYHGQDLCDHELAVFFFFTSHATIHAMLTTSPANKLDAAPPREMEAARIKAIFNNVLARLVV